MINNILKKQKILNDNENKKVCFIIPYFGYLPNYFQLFLNSCKHNKTYEWILFTDDNTLYIFPENVRKINMKFDEYKKIIQNKYLEKIEQNRRGLSKSVTIEQCN